MNAQMTTVDAGTCPICFAACELAPSQAYAGLVVRRCTNALCPWQSPSFDPKARNRRRRRRSIAVSEAPSTWRQDAHWRDGDER